MVRANTDELIAEAKELFKEYAESLGFDLCFKKFDAELECFPVQYSPPSGDLSLALSERQPIGCVGVRFLEEGICEMKRLYVKPNFRGSNAGKDLCEAAIQGGKILGYERMRLDTLPSMEIANRLYKTLGFVEIEPYRHNPLEGAIYLELNLTRL
ncbi:MAG: GNAT family N-acetyltransferase [Deltaproteobacteria bacterium]|nr:GNAT family N-acetyltransferase [Deltaproteobacteria bacterium]